MIFDFTFILLILKLNNSRFVLIEISNNNVNIETNETEDVENSLINSENNVTPRHNGTRGNLDKDTDYYEFITEAESSILSSPHNKSHTHFDEEKPPDYSNYYEGVPLPQINTVSSLKICTHYKLYYIYI